MTFPYFLDLVQFLIFLVRDIVAFLFLFVIIV